MQLALNVNTALMALMRANVFCTEPFRVPLAGKISACLFDKTGTLTTDQLEAVGVSRGEVSAAQRARSESFSARSALALASCGCVGYLWEGGTGSRGARKRATALAICGEEAQHARLRRVRAVPRWL